MNRPSALTRSSGVVHIVQHPHSAGAPADLMLDLRTPSRVWSAIAVVVAAACLAAIVAFWLFATPNGWHIPINIFWTVVFGAIAVAAVVGDRENRATSIRRRADQARWSAVLDRVQAMDATVVARDVGTGDDGVVGRIELTVRTEDGSTFDGRWTPRRGAGGAAKLLQSQIPGVGSPVTVWRVPDADDGTPYVIEYVDPSVTQHGAESSGRVYL